MSCFGNLDERYTIGKFGGKSLPILGHCPRDPAADIMADHGGRAANQGLDRCGNIRCEIVISNAFERSGTAANASRLCLPVVPAPVVLPLLRRIADRSDE